MLIHLKNKKFIGDLSLQDADILVQYADQSRDILEFGSGGSTQLLSQSAVNSIISIETNASWIEKTQKKLQTLNTAHKVTFLPYTDQFYQEFDMIFVDGVWNLRQQFATETWKNLRVGGVMLFHDTRRDFDFENMLLVSRRFYTEISAIDVNARASDGQSSNISVIHKKSPEPYVNWNETENKPLWSYGSGEPPTDELWSYDHSMMGTTACSETGVI